MLQANTRSAHPLDRPLPKQSLVTSSAAFGLVFSELVQYHQSRVTSISDLERRLEQAGFGIGAAVLEAVSAREKVTKRETSVLGILSLVAGPVWKHLFGKAADSLEKSVDGDAYMLYDSQPVTSTYVSVPADMGQVSDEGA